MCKPVAKTLFNQWQTMIESDCMPVLEYELLNGDYLTVDISFVLFRGKSGFRFDFDKLGLNTCFSGAVKSVKDTQYLPLDKYFSNLDTYLQQIDQEIMEGFLIFNNLI